MKPFMGLVLLLLIVIMNDHPVASLRPGEVQSRGIGKSKTTSNHNHNKRRGSAAAPRYNAHNDNHQKNEPNYARNYFSEDDAVEINPDYIYYTPPSPAPSSSYSDEHEEWLRQQEFTIAATGSSYNNNNNRYDGLSLWGKTKNNFIHLHKLSPSLYWMTLSCIAIFILWGMPLNAPFLVKFLVCSRNNVAQTMGLSLVFSAISHISFRHLLVNLVTLLHIGPTVRKEIISQQQPLWPFLLMSAIASNLFYIMFASDNNGSGACLGLSGVTAALFAVLASAFPNRIFGMIIGVFPVRFKAKDLLQLLLVISAVGGFFEKQSGIAHLNHLGGLLFGMGYYEWVIQNKNSFQKIKARGGRHLQAKRFKFA